MAVTAGEVSSFDAGTGLGTVTGADGRPYPFHCTQLADGTRTIEVGAAVSFVVVAGLGGRWEAAAISRR